MLRAADPPMSRGICHWMTPRSNGNPALHTRPSQMTATARPTPVAELPSVWRDQASYLRRMCADAQAVGLECAADTLEAPLAAEADRLLTATEAAAMTGRKPETIRKAMREGRLRDAGRKGAPRVLAGDLALLLDRSTCTPPRSRGKFDPCADAQALLEERREV